MKKALFILAIIILILTANAFGQNHRKKRNFYNLPDVNDEVHFTFDQKHRQPKVLIRQRSTKRKRTILNFDEADAIFGKTKSRKTRRKNK